jgi:hypothetical protein
MTNQANMIVWFVLLSPTILVWAQFLPLRLRLR